MHYNLENDPVNIFRRNKKIEYEKIGERRLVFYSSIAIKENPVIIIPSIDIIAR
jgi:hypothetical protein